MGAIITGFGFGVMQFSTGLAYNTGLEVNNLMYIIVVAITLLILCFSSARGFQKGLAVLSNINVAGYIILLVVLFCFGPTLKLCELALGSMGRYWTTSPMAFNGDFMGDGDGWNVKQHWLHLVLDLGILTVLRNVPGKRFQEAVLSDNSSLPAQSYRPASCSYGFASGAEMR